MTWVERPKKVAKWMEKLDNRPQAVEPLQHEIRLNLPGAFISHTIQHHTYTITLNTRVYHKF